MPQLTAITALLSSLLLSSTPLSAGASPVDSSGKASSIRTRRPIAMTLGPEAYVFHVQEYSDAAILPALRLGANLTPRIGLTASVAGFPNFITAYDLGVAAALSEGALTPYTGVSLGAVTHAGEDSRGSTDPFFLGVLGVSYVTSNGLDLSIEAAVGYQRERGGLSGPNHRDSVLMRIGLRVGYRFGS